MWCPVECMITKIVVWTSHYTEYVFCANDEKLPGT